MFTTYSRSPLLMCVDIEFTELATNLKLIKELRTDSKFSPYLKSSKNKILMSLTLPDVNPISG